MEKQANKHQRELDFDIGDLVQVTMKNQKTKRLSHKLDYQIARLYLILEKVSNLYRVNLLETIKVYLVFLLDKLQKASKDLLLEQKNKLPLLIQVDSKDKQEVEEILASKVVHGSLKYHTSWKGYNPNPNWYLAQNFVRCPHKLKEFYNRYPKQPRPPKYLDKQLECQHDKDDKQPIEHKDKNALALVVNQYLSSCFQLPQQSTKLLLQSTKNTIQEA